MDATPIALPIVSSNSMRFNFTFKNLIRTASLFFLALNPTSATPRLRGTAKSLQRAASLQERLSLINRRLANLPKEMGLGAQANNCSFNPDVDSSMGNDSVCENSSFGDETIIENTAQTRGIDVHGPAHIEFGCIIEEENVELIFLRSLTTKNNDIIYGEISKSAIDAVSIFDAVAKTRTFNQDIELSKDFINDIFVIKALDASEITPAPTPTPTPAPTLAPTPTPPPTIYIPGSVPDTLHDILVTEYRGSFAESSINEYAFSNDLVVLVNQKNQLYFISLIGNLPTLLQTIDSDNSVNAVAINKDLIAVAYSSSVEIFSRANLEKGPVLELSDGGRSLGFQGNILLSGGSHFIAWDLTDITQPKEIANHDGNINKMFVDKNRAFALGIDNIGIIDVSNPSDIGLLDEEDVCFLSCSTMNYHDNAMVMTQGTFAWIADVTDPIDVQLSTDFILGYSTLEGIKVDKTLITANGDIGFRIYDASDINNPIELSETKFEYFHVDHVVVQDNSVIFIDKDQGFKIFKKSDILLNTGNSGDPILKPSAQLITEHSMNDVVMYSNHTKAIAVGDASLTQLDIAAAIAAQTTPTLNTTVLDFPETIKMVATDGEALIIASDNHLAFGSVSAVNDLTTFTSESFAQFKIGDYDLPYQIQDVVIREMDGRKAFIAIDYGIFVIDIENPSDPKLFNFLPAASSYLSSLLDKYGADIFLKIIQINLSSPLLLAAGITFAALAPIAGLPVLLGGIFGQIFVGPFIQVFLATDFVARHVIGVDPNFQKEKISFSEDGKRMYSGNGAGFRVYFIQDNKINNQSVYINPKLFNTFDIAYKCLEFEKYIICPSFSAITVVELDSNYRNIISEHNYQFSNFGRAVDYSDQAIADPLNRIFGDWINGNDVVVESVTKYKNYLFVSLGNIVATNEDTYQLNHDRVAILEWQGDRFEKLGDLGIRGDSLEVKDDLLYARDRVNGLTIFDFSQQDISSLLSNSAAPAEPATENTQLDMTPFLKSISQSLIATYDTSTFTKPISPIDTQLNEYHAALPGLMDYFVAQNQTEIVEPLQTLNSSLNVIKQHLVKAEMQNVLSCYAIFNTHKNITHPFFALNNQTTTSFEAIQSNFNQTLKAGVQELELVKINTNENVQSTIDLITA